MPMKAYLEHLKERKGRSWQALKEALNVDVGKYCADRGIPNVLTAQIKPLGFDLTSDTIEVFWIAWGIQSIMYVLE